MTQGRPINLKERYGKQYKVMDDGTDDTDRIERIWCMTIPGKHGIIYLYGLDGSLAVTLNSKKLARKIRDLGLRSVQWGDKESTFVFTPDLMETICSIIKAKKRRHLTPEQKERSIAIFAKLRQAKTNSKGVLGRQEVPS